jgi:arylsulfatase A-like enzyme
MSDSEHLPPHGPPGGPDDPARRPNVLLVVCDQLRADHVGFGGSPLVRTPNLDALAARGRVFDRAHVANPICMPNRASIVTGRSPSAHGLNVNAGALAWSTNTFVRQLRLAGYRTFHVGKADHQNGLRRLLGAAVVGTSDVAGPAPLGDPYPPGWDTWEDAARFTEEPFADPDDFYGYAHLALTLGHADMVGGHHLRWAVAQGADPEDLARGGARDALARSEHWWQVYKPRLPEELSSTSYVTEATIAAIESAGRDGAPWFVHCSFPDPHHPFAPTGRWFDRHDPADVPLPETFADDLSGAPSHYRAFRAQDASPMPVLMFGPTADQYRAAAAAEAGAIEAIDHGVGRVLAALERTGAAEDTVVLFTSDHGDMFGDHGLMLKGVMHYAGCTRVPLVVAGPGVGTPGRTTSLAGSLDIAPTVLGLTGTPGYDGIQGHDLAPVLADPTAQVQDCLYVEEDFPQAGLFPFPVPDRVRTLVTDGARVTRFGGTGEAELYDLGDDPLERRNLWDDPAAATLRRQATERLLDEVVAHAVPPRLGPSSA